MAEIEKVIKDLKEVKHEVKVGTASRMINESTNAIDNAIWTIRELQNQIPKWHYVADGDLPSDDEYLNSKLCWDEYRERCVFARFVNGSWIMGNGDESVKVIAWMELPKFESEAE